MKTVGWKIRTWDATNGVRLFSGKVGSSQQKVINDIKGVPPSGFQVGMLYYDTFSIDGRTRYRRVLMGNDLYYVKAGILEPIFGQTDDPANPELTGSVTLTGTFAPPDIYDAIVAEAMSDEVAP